MDTQRFSRIANGLKSASISSVTQTADALRREGKEVLVFSIGRPDFDTPEHIKAAANDALAKGFVHYTHNRGILPMREAVAAYLKRQNGLDYDPKTEIMITAGAQEALMLCTHALLDPGDEVLVPSPGFLLYYSSIPMLHAVPVPYVLKEPDYDWDGAPVSDRTKLMIFNNPNNPTGKVFSAEEMRDAADFVKKHDRSDVLCPVGQHRHLLPGVSPVQRTGPFWAHHFGHRKAGCHARRLFDCLRAGGIKNLTWLLKTHTEITWKFAALPTSQEEYPCRPRYCVMESKCRWKVSASFRCRMPPCENKPSRRLWRQVIGLSIWFWSIGMRKPWEPSSARAESPARNCSSSPPKYGFKRLAMRKRRKPLKRP